MNEEEYSRESAGQENAVGSPLTETEQAEAETTGTAAGGSAEEESGNRKMAAARRSGKREAEEAFDKEIAAYGVLDGEGKPITTRKELSAFLRATGESQLSARAKAAGKSVDEQRTEEDERARGRKAKQEEDSRAERQERAAEQVAELREAYPKVDVISLLDDGNFKSFCGSRFGKESLLELYESYQELVVENRKAESREEKKSRSTGSGSGAESGGALSSREERDRQEWNRRYPNMKMSAKEWSEYNK